MSAKKRIFAQKVYWHEKIVLVVYHIDDVFIL